MVREGIPYARSSRTEGPVPHVAELSLGGRRRSKFAERRDPVEVSGVFQTLQLITAADLFAEHGVLSVEINALRKIHTTFTSISLPRLFNTGI